MLIKLMNRAFTVLVVLYAAWLFCSPVLTQAETPVTVKELNFVFLHGAGGNSGSMQLLSDLIMERIPKYIADYEAGNPGVKIQVDGLLRCYPNDVDIKEWANNIVYSIDKHFSNKKNLILVGHSMGGKTSLYTVANNVGGIAEKVAMVATINSPVRSLGDYAFTSGVSASYINELGLVSDRGVIGSIFSYDSSKDGKKVAQDKRWLAFVSAENSPTSAQFNTKGLDPLPRDMDDTIVPISAQYADGADIIYYGEQSHSQFGTSIDVAGYIANQILNYIFGARISFSVLANIGTLENTAGILPKIYRWNDVVSEILVDTGVIEHKNQSLTGWQEWEDIVGITSMNIRQSSYRIEKESWPFPFSSIKESYWVNTEDQSDCRVFLKTSAAPKSTVKVKWSIYQKGLLPDGIEREHYEIRITSGTPFTAINRVAWVSDDLRDIRLNVASQAEGPFRWFRAEWKIFQRDIRSVGIIDSMQ